jgi:hypothetical protein
MKTKRPLKGEGECYKQIDSWGLQMYKLKVLIFTASLLLGVSGIIFFFQFLYEPRQKENPDAKLVYALLCLSAVYGGSFIAGKLPKSK